MIILKTPRGRHEILLDEQDAYLLEKYRWTALKSASRTTRYARVSLVKGQEETAGLSMHNLIMNPPKGMFVDHKDGNGLNNQRENLRICTRAQNGQNKGKPRIATSSQYIGVSRWHDRWLAQITLAFGHMHLGVYDTELEAALARDIAAKDFYGEFARLNNPLKEAI